MQEARARGGFNLLEVVMATFMFSVIAIIFTGVWGQHMRAMEKSRHYLVGSHLAESLIEEKMARGYAAVQSETTNDSFQMLTRVKGVDINATYNYTVTVTDIGSSDDRKKAVLVRVYWDTEDTTQTGEVFLETVLGSAE